MQVRIDESREHILSVKIHVLHLAISKLRQSANASLLDLACIGY